MTTDDGAITTGTGAEPLYRPTPITLSIEELVRRVGERRLRVPTFQRSFVWDAEDVRTLLDSIWRGYPFGTLLLWKRSAPERLSSTLPPFAAFRHGRWTINTRPWSLSASTGWATTGGSGDPQLRPPRCSQRLDH
jgi:hypothetical protein